MIYAFGVYNCRRCDNDYMVNDQWKPCSPDFCHDCFEHLNKQEEDKESSAGGARNGD